MLKSSRWSDSWFPSCFGRCTKLARKTVENVSPKGLIVQRVHMPAVKQFTCGIHLCHHARAEWLKVAALFLIHIQIFRFRKRSKSEGRGSVPTSKCRPKKVGRSFGTC